MNNNKSNKIIHIRSYWMLSKYFSELIPGSPTRTPRVVRGKWTGLCLRWFEKSGYRIIGYVKKLRLLGDLFTRKYYQKLTNQKLTKFWNLWDIEMCQFLEHDCKLYHTRYEVVQSYLFRSTFLFPINVSNLHTHLIWFWKLILMVIFRSKR